MCPAIHGGSPALWRRFTARPFAGARARLRTALTVEVQLARLFLVDGSNHAFRVQFALPPSHTLDGFPTRALYGFVLLFQKMLASWKPDYVAVAFDTGSTFRHDMYPDYKGHRPDMPEDLARQWPFLPQLVEGFGYPAVAVPGYEADDVLGTLAKQLAGPDLEVFIVSSDKDFCQLVDDNISLLDEAKGVTLRRDEVIEKWGVPPERVIDLLALMGDSSDNIPGVSKIGQKTGAKLVNDFGGLEDILSAAAAGKVSGKTGERLVAEAENARLSRRLATIVTDVDTGKTLQDLAPKGLQEDVLRELFERFEFGAVARKLLPERKAVDTSVWRTLAVGDDLVPMIAEIRAVGRVAIEVDPGNGDALRGLALAWGADRTVYVPGEILSQNRQDLLSMLADPSVGKVTSDSKRVARLLADAGMPIAGVDADTRLLDYVLASHRKNHGVDSVARLIGHSLQNEPPPIAPPSAWAGFTQEIAQVVWVAEQKMAARLDPGTARVYRDIELPLVPVLTEMERAGLRVDLAGLAGLKADFEVRIEDAARRCHEAAGEVFNLRSRNELQRVLFQKLELPTGKKTMDGFSTDSSVLEKLGELHPLPALILEFRSLEKLLGTYVNTLPSWVAADGRIHTTFNQAVAATGRLASNDPNLQNIPIRSFEGRRIRECFVPEAGSVFLSADYSQVELRVLAHFTDDETLIAGFRAGEDIHRRTAAEVFGIAPEAVTLEHRSAAKAINFGLLYGMSAFRLAGDLMIPQSQAQQYMDEYFGRMPRVAGWIDDTRVKARKDGAVETLFGRRRLIPEIWSSQYNERMAAEREAVNTRIQGTAADIIKIAMIRAHEMLRSSGLRSRLVLQVHDELLFEGPENEVDAVSRLAVEAMEGAADLKVPLAVNVKVGANWQAAHG
jgi:DNA polymerase-1